VCSLRIIEFEITQQSRELPQGSEAKPLPATKANLGLLSDFPDVEKSSVYRSGYTCGFSTSRKSNINPTSTFSLRVGFPCLLRRGTPSARYHCAEASEPLKDRLVLLDAH
jgi:hypothetical protein